MIAPEAYGIRLARKHRATKRQVVLRPTIARNTSGFTRQEVMAALKVAGSKPSSSLLLDLTKTAYGYKGWCAYYPEGWVIWTHKSIEYVADCHIRLRVCNADILPYTLRIKRGKKRVVLVSRWQALCLLLAHELGHWRQAAKDGKSRCLQIDADKNAIRVAKKLGIW